MESIHRRNVLKALGLGMASGGVAWATNQLRLGRWLETRRRAQVEYKSHPPPGSVLFGGYFGERASPEYLQAHALLEPMLAVETLFPTWDDPTWGLTAVRDINAKGRIAQVSLRPFDGVPGAGYTPAHLARDEQMIRSRLHAHAGTTAWWRFGYEMNGSWFEHGTKVNSPQEWQDMYRRFVDMARDEAPNLRHVFCPYSTWDIAEFYPGDTHVDMVGLNIFRKYTDDPTSPLHYTEAPLTFLESCGPEIAWYQTYTPHKPIVISEVGADVHTHRSHMYLTDAYDQAPRIKNVIAVLAFATDKSRAAWSERDWYFPGASYGQDLVDRIRSNSLYDRRMAQATCSGSLYDRSSCRK